MSSELLLAVAGNAAGAGEATYVEDVFSTYLYTGNGGTQNIENGIALSDANSGGSAAFNGTSGSRVRVNGNSAYDLSGNDWTVEYFFYTNNAGVTQVHVDNSQNGSYGPTMEFELYSGGTGALAYVVNGTIPISSSTGLIQSNTWHHIAVSTVSGTSTLYLDGTAIGTTTTLPDANTYHWEIGDRVTSAGSGNYPVNGNISNFRMVVGTGVYTTAFTPPSAPLEAVANTQVLCLQGDEPFTDNSGNSRTISVSTTGVEAKAFGPFTSDTAGKGGLVWVKARNFSSPHILVDTERGVNNNLRSHQTIAEYTQDTVTAFNSNGFSVTGANGDVGTSGNDYASWTFAKQEKFFDVVTYTGTGTAQNISHNLGSTPGMIIIKDTSGTNHWIVGHRSLDYTTGKYLILSSTAAVGTTTAVWNNTAPTSSVFTVGTNSTVNTNGNTYVAYLFAHNNGDGIFGETGDQDIIKCGSVTMDGSGNASVDLGFEPQWVMTKLVSSSGYNWQIFDNMRGFPASPSTTIPTLAPNSSAAENNSGDPNITSTGFEWDSSVGLANGTYIYIAIRRGPMKTPESGTEVFDTVFPNGSSTNPTFVTNFPVDFATSRVRNSTNNWNSATRLTGTEYLEFNTTAAGSPYSLFTFDFQNGWAKMNLGSYGTNWYSHVFRRAPGFFDVVAYEGDGTAGHNVNHNLGVAPEFIITKQRDAGGGHWWSYHQSLGNTKGIGLSLTNTPSTSTTFWNDTSPTSDVFTLGTYANVNGSGSNYIAYLFATLPGVSKVGSYTGTSALQTIDCGFSSGARFVLIKRTDANSSWYVFDSERGIVAGNDPWLQLNDSAAENTSTDYIDPNSSGFELSASSSLNVSPREYIFYAIA